MIVFFTGMLRGGENMKRMEKGEEPIRKMKKTYSNTCFLKHQTAQGENNYQRPIPAALLSRRSLKKSFNIWEHSTSKIPPVISSR